MRNLFSHQIEYNMNKLLLFTLVFLGTLSLFSCGKKDLPSDFEPSATNGESGTVIDMSSLEGGACGDMGLMLDLDNGARLNIQHDFDLDWQAGDRVRVKYEPLYVASACQNGASAYLYEVEAASGIYQHTVVRYGTSFSMWTINCVTSWTFVPGYMNLSDRPWTSQNEEDEPCTFSNSDTDWSNILNAIAESDFANAPDTIGCPDCQGQGAEWIEFEQDGKIQRVVFEYDAVDLPVQALVDQVRLIRDREGECPN